jgi:hypothetical protein
MRPFSMSARLIGVVFFLFFLGGAGLNGVKCIRV